MKRKVTLTIEEETYSKVKRYCEKSGAKISTTMEAALNWWLEIHAPKVLK